MKVFANGGFGFFNTLTALYMVTGGKLTANVDLVAALWVGFIQGGAAFFMQLKLESDVHEGERLPKKQL